MNSRGQGGDYTKFHHKYTDAQYSNTWIKAQLQAVMTLRLIAAYNQIRLTKKNTGSLKIEDTLTIAKAAYPRQYANNKELARKRVIRMLKTKEVKQLADQSLVQLLMEQGITKGYLTKTRQKILDGCMADKKYETALKALQGFEEMHNLMSKATFQSTETREEVDYSKFLATKTVKTIEVEATDNVTISAGNLENEEKTRENTSEAEDEGKNKSLEAVQAQEKGKTV